MEKFKKMHYYYVLEYLNCSYLGLVVKGLQNFTKGIVDQIINLLTARYFSMAFGMLLGRSKLLVRP